MRQMISTCHLTLRTIEDEVISEGDRRRHGGATSTGNRVVRFRLDDTTHFANGYFGNSTSPCSSETTQPTATATSSPTTATASPQPPSGSQRGVALGKWRGPVGVPGLPDRRWFRVSREEGMLNYSLGIRYGSLPDQ